MLNTFKIVSYFYCEMNSARSNLKHFNLLNVFEENVLKYIRNCNISGWDRIPLQFTFKIFLSRFWTSITNNSHRNEFRHRDKEKLLTRCWSNIGLISIVIFNALNWIIALKHTRSAHINMNFLHMTGQSCFTTYK